MKLRSGILTLAFIGFSLSLSAQTTEISFLELGLNQNKSGNYADALRNFTLEIEKTAANPNPIAFYNRGFAKYNLKDFQGAILDFNKALELKTITLRHLLPVAKAIANKITIPLPFKITMKLFASIL